MYVFDTLGHCGRAVNLMVEGSLSIKGRKLLSNHYIHILSKDIEFCYIARSVLNPKSINTELSVSIDEIKHAVFLNILIIVLYKSLIRFRDTLDDRGIFLDIITNYSLHLELKES